MLRKVRYRLLCGSLLQYNQQRRGVNNMGEEKKRLPVGLENFEQIIKDNYYYVDKTGLISELIRNGGMVNLFTRPRRFGKTLNMSMLEYFFP